MKGACRRFSLVLSIMMIDVYASPMMVLAQDDSVEQAEEVIPSSEDEIIVEGRALRGRALSDIEPELVLTEEDIAAYGVSSFAELLALLQAETSSGRGRRSEPPVVLINGRRVSGFRELDNYPIEAISRVEVLPEEVSLAYGFSANQRVINFILKPNLNIIPLNTRTQAPTRGGTVSNRINLSRVVIDGDKRSSLEGVFSYSSPLFESERNIIPLSEDLVQEFRTLIPERTNWRAGFSRSRDLPGGVVGTLSASFENTDTERLTGASPLDLALSLDQQSDIKDGYLGISINSPLAINTWSLTASVDFDRSAIDTELFNTALETTENRFTQSTDWVGKVDFILNRRLGETSAGYATMSAQAGIQTEHQRAVTVETDTANTARQSRQTFTGRLSANYPFLLPSDDLGDVSVNGNIEVAHLTDLGTLVTVGYGVTWYPREKLRIIFSGTHEEGAPNLSQIASPIVVTPFTQIFDFSTQESTLAELIVGGNPALGTDQRDVYKVGVQWKPWKKPDLTFNVDFTTFKITGETRQFTLLTEEFEGAFPDRVFRDESGALLSFDRRPVQVAETARQQIRTGITFRKNLKAKRIDPARARKSRRPRSGRPGSLRASVYHRWVLRDRVIVSDGVAPFDFLDGAAGEGLGGTPGHVVDASVYCWNNGWGFFASGQYRSPTEVIGPFGSLRFDTTFRAIVSVSYEFNFADSLLDVMPFLEETRLSMGVGNLFDDVVDVRDDNGDVPLRFQPNLLDPVRAGWRIELRKRF